MPWHLGSCQGCHYWYGTSSLPIAIGKAPVWCQWLLFQFNKSMIKIWVHIIYIIMYHNVRVIEKRCTVTNLPRALKTLLCHWWRLNILLLCYGTLLLHWDKWGLFICLYHCCYCSQHCLCIAWCLLCGHSCPGNEWKASNSFYGRIVLLVKYDNTL